MGSQSASKHTDDETKIVAIEQTTFSIFMARSCILLLISLTFTIWGLISNAFVTNRRQASILNQWGLSLLRHICVVRCNDLEQELTSLILKHKWQITLTVRRQFHLQLYVNISAISQSITFHERCHSLNWMLCGSVSDFYLFIYLFFNHVGQIIYRSCIYFHGCHFPGNSLDLLPMLIHLKRINYL